MIDKKHSGLSISEQCRILCIHRSGLYYSPVPESEANLHIMRLMDEQYFKTPFYGQRRLRRWLLAKGLVIAKTRVKRLMGLLGWQTIYHKKNTSKRSKGHPVYPYLLKDLEITRPNQVWAIDITYVPMRKGFMYLFAIIDLHTRYVLGWGISNTMSAEWCTRIIKEAIELHGQPEIINSDQGGQFQSDVYLNLLQKRETPIAISMDSKGRAIDNIFIERLWKSVKYECVYIRVFEDGVQLYEGLKEYFEFYNNERMHQALDYKTPASLYKLAA